MEVAPGQEIDVEVGARVVGDRLEEPLQHGKIHRAARALIERDVPVQVRSSGEIDDRARQGLVEREVEATRAGDSLAVAERLVDGAPERDPGVLDGVVLVDLQVALAVDPQVERGVLRQRLQHVIEKGDPGRDLRVSAAVQLDGDVQIRLLRLARDLCCAAHARASPVSASRRESTRVVSPGASM